MENLAKQLNEHKKDIIDIILLCSALEKEDEKRDYDALQEKYDNVHDKASEIKELFAKLTLEFIPSLLEIVNVFSEMKQYMTADEAEQAEKEIKNIEEDILSSNTNFKNLLEDEKIPELLIAYISIKNFFGFMLFFTNMLNLYDKYFDYLPLERMPNTFPDGERKSFDIADDLLFIDDLD